MISEDDVKAAIKGYLVDQGFEDVQARFGRENGYDVEGRDPFSRRLLAVECKGEANTARQWETAWRNAADAIFKALYAHYHTRLSQPNLDVGIAFPATRDYRERMQHLEPFCRQQGITVFWADNEGISAGGEQSEPKSEPERIAGPHSLAAPAQRGRCAAYRLGAGIGYSQPVSPTVLRAHGYRFYFFSREEPRPHVHVQHASGEAKFWLEPEVALAADYGLGRTRINTARKIIEEHRDEIRAAWARHFGS